MDETGKKIDLLSEKLDAAVTALANATSCIIEMSGAIRLLMHANERPSLSGIQEFKDELKRLESSIDKHTDELLLGIEKVLPDE